MQPLSRPPRALVGFDLDQTIAPRFSCPFSDLLFYRIVLFCLRLGTSMYFSVHPPTFLFQSV